MKKNPVFFNLLLSQLINDRCKPSRNYLEASILCKFVDAMANAGVPMNTMTVFTPHMSQLYVLSPKFIRRASHRGCKIERLIRTIGILKGAETEVVINVTRT